MHEGTNAGSTSSTLESAYMCQDLRKALGFLSVNMGVFDPCAFLRFRSDQMPWSESLLPSSAAIHSGNQEGCELLLHFILMDIQGLSPQVLEDDLGSISQDRE